MDRDRVLTAPLAGFLLVAAGVLGWCGAVRWWPKDQAAIVRALRDGDLEGAERRALLARLIALGADADPAATGGLDRSRLSALAAVARDDDGASDSPIFSRAFGPEAPPIAGTAVDDLAMGDPVLRQLLSGMAAEAAGEKAAARLAYTATEASARLFHMRAARELARRGVERVR